MRSCRHVLCVCAVLADVRLANVKKPLIPSTSGWLVAGKKAEKSKKRPIDFLYGLSSLRIRCIQRPNARILLRKWPESGRQHRIYVSEWNENSNVIATKTTTEQPKQQQPKKRDEHKHSNKWQYCMNMETHHKRGQKTHRSSSKSFSLSCYDRMIYSKFVCSFTAPNNRRMLKRYTAEKTNWNALSRVLFSVLSFSFCVNLLRVVCGFFLLFSLLLFTHSLTALCVGCVAPAKRLECCCCVELFDDKWRTEKTSKKWLPCMHHLHMSAWPASAWARLFYIIILFPDKRLHVKFEYYDVLLYWLWATLLLLLLLLLLQPTTCLPISCM